MTDRLLTIVAGDRSSSRCKWCGQPIEWAVKASTPNSPAKRVPLQPNPFILRYERNPGGVKFLVIAADNLHFVHCKQRPATQRRVGSIYGARR